MHFDGWNTIEGRHLVYAYAFVVLVQGGYLGWIARQWFRMNHDEKQAQQPH